MDFSNSACDFVYLFILGKKLSMNWPFKKKSGCTASVGWKHLWGRKRLEGCSKVSKYQEKVVKTNWTEAILEIARKDS